MRAPLLITGILVACLAPGARTAEPTTPKPEAYQVPYRLTDTFHILIRAKINGKGPFNYILDTGAPVLFVSTAVGKKLGIETDKDGWGNIERFEIEGGPVVLHAKGRVEDPFQLEGMNGLGLAGVHLDGIIGYNIIARYRIEFDFTSDRLVWTPLAFEPPLPQSLGGKAATPGGLNALGAFMKMLGAFLGKKPPPQVIFRGLFGFELADADGAILVKSVLAGGPAAALVQAGDHVTRFQGKKIAAAADFYRLASLLAPGTSVELTLQRGAESRQVTIKLEQGF